MSEAEEDQPLDSGGESDSNDSGDSSDSGGDDAFGIDGDDSSSSGSEESSTDTSSSPSSSPPMGDEDSAGENSPDEKRKKVKYFQEFEKILGVIEEFIDAVTEKSQSTPSTDVFCVKNFEFIKNSLIEYKDKTTEVLVKGITKLSYTDLIRLFFHIQNSVNEIKKLYTYTLEQSRKNNKDTQV